MAKGWIKLHRQITEHWLYKENRIFSKFEAWQDILLHVNHAPNKFIVKGELISLDAGQTARSQVTLTKKWKWSRKKVSNFLKLLEKDHMIMVKTTKNTTVITVVNWQAYQEKEPKKDMKTTLESKSYEEQGTSEEHRKHIESTSKEHQKHINKNVKNNKNEKNERENLSTQDFNKNLKKNNLTKKITAESVSDELKQFYKTENGFNNWKEIIDVLQFKIPNKSIRNKKIKEMLSAMSRQYVLNDRWNESESIQIKHTRFLDWIARERTLN